MSDAPDCPRCAELRGRAVRMSEIRKGPADRTVILAYECRSCDYTIPLAPFPGNTMQTNPRTAFRVDDGRIVERNILIGDRCVDGHIYRHVPQSDDPYFEQEIGICADCRGCGCQHDISERLP